MNGRSLRPRTLRQRLAAVIVSIAACATASAAAAHPHVWIDTVVTIRFDDGKVSRIEMDWTFDEFYSALVGADFDRNRNGRLDPEELETLAQQSAEAMRATGYFAHIRLGDALRQIDGSERVSASVHDRRIRYRISLPLASPVDPAKTALTIGVYDESYYVDIALDEHDPVRLAGANPGACHFSLVPDAANPIYFGMVTPTVVKLLCTAK